MQTLPRRPRAGKNDVAHELRIAARYLEARLGAGAYATKIPNDPWARMLDRAASEVEALTNCQKRRAA